MNQTLKLETILTEIKISLKEFNSTLDQAEDGLSKIQR